MTPFWKNRWWKTTPIYMCMIFHKKIFQCVTAPIPLFQTPQKIGLLKQKYFIWCILHMYIHTIVQINAWNINPLWHLDCNRKEGNKAEGKKLKLSFTQIFKASKIRYLFNAVYLNYFIYVYISKYFPKRYQQACTKFFFVDKYTMFSLVKKPHKF